MCRMHKAQQILTSNQGSQKRQDWKSKGKGSLKLKMTQGIDQ